MDYDALLFHAAQTWSIFRSVPTQRSDHQTYVMVNLESPAHTKHELNTDHDFYNMTMTYRSDSDIVWPYSIIVDVETGEQIAPVPGRNWPKWRMPEENFFGKNKTCFFLINVLIINVFQINVCSRLPTEKQKRAHGLCQTVLRFHNETS
jgi:hypothetical protein